MTWLAWVAVTAPPCSKAQAWLDRVCAHNESHEQLLCVMGFVVTAEGGVARVQVLAADHKWGVVACPAAVAAAFPAMFPEMLHVVAGVGCSYQPDG
jgi:hypothetical protein